MTRQSSLRESILTAAKDLIWERGVENMSPRDVMDRSGAGQGSLYHHLRSKQFLVRAALEAMKDEEIATVGAIFDPALPPLVRIERYFLRERKIFQGCRLARISSEAAMEDPLLREPVAAFLDHVTGLLGASLKEAQERGDIRQDVDAPQIAATLMSIVEGGFVLARAHWDEQKMREALAGGMTLLACLRVER